MRKLTIPDDVAALVRTLHPRIKKKVKSSLQYIVSDPHSGKALSDELKGLRSFRVGRFRIIYRITDRKEIEIVAIGPRERIYEDTYRIIAKEQKE
jgi:mRNA interferase RelE/StbE